VNSLESPEKALPQDERTLTIDILRDLTHNVIDHFVKITEQSVLSRRAIATQALNLADRSKLMSAELGADLFGGQWESLEETDAALRKRNADQAALRARSTSAKRGRGSGSNPGRGRGAAPRRAAAVQQYPQQYGAAPPLMQYGQQPMQQPMQYFQQPPSVQSPRGRGRGKPKKSRQRKAKGQVRGGGSSRGRSRAADRGFDPAAQGWTRF
jgi:hypothetical protein